MTDLQRIKKRIYDEERIEELLGLLGCTGVSTEQRGSLYVAPRPDGSSPRSVQVKNSESLNSSVRSRGIDGDIYDLVAYFIYSATTKEESREFLPKSKYWICSRLGYMEYIDEFYKETSESTEESTINYNDWLLKIQDKVAREPFKNRVIDSSELEKYGILPYDIWINEGISYGTQVEFGIGIDVQSERVTFPIHNKEGDLIGVKGRYCGRDKVVEGRYKYLYLIPCNKSTEFFNLHRALPYIGEYKEVIVVEGAKTAMLLWSWGYRNVISIEGDSLSDAQVNLLKELGLEIKYVFVWDKDKSMEHVKSEVQRLHGRLRYAMLDVENILEGKESPVDKGRGTWSYLYTNYLFRIS